MAAQAAGKAAPRRMALDELAFAPRFAYGEQCQIAGATGTDDGTTLGTGFARFSGAAIPWTIKYDEVLLVIEGRLEVETESGTFALGPRDSLWLPVGTALTYRSESALVFYAIHPSDWAETAS